jgi:nucleotide-binding universal stress UspA family protein
LAKKGSGRVTLFHALHVIVGEAYPLGFQVEAESEARASLARWQQQFQAAGVPQVDTIFDSRHPIPAVLDTLQNLDISLIVMGTQGKGFITEIFLGSVAHTVSRLAPCPVLLIPTPRE